MPDKPWLRYRDTGLSILPYRHYALEFAALPFQAGVGDFDVIDLELPSWMPVDRVRDSVAAVTPGTGGILFPSADPVEMVVSEFINDPRPVKRQVLLSGLLPITTDAMMSVLRIVAANPDRGPRVEFVDTDEAEAADEEEGAPFPCVDAQEVVERGLAGWYARWAPLLRGRTPQRSDAYREAHMALRLIESVLRPGAKALFVCGALHWHRIEALLDADDPAELRRRMARLLPEPEKRAGPPRQRWLGEVAREPGLADFVWRRLTTCSLEPSVLHSMDFLDIPFVVGEFERELAAGTLSVDRPGWIRRMLASCWERNGRPVSARVLAVLESFLNRRLISDGRWSCDLDRHLLPCAAAAAGRSFAHELEQEAMRCDLRPSGDPPEGRVVPQPNGAQLIFVGDEVHLVKMPDSGKAGKTVRRPFRERRRGLTDKERDSVMTGGLMMKPPCEELLNRHMCDTARRLGHECLPFRKPHRPRPFRGSLGKGPDARRTMRAAACGDRTLYVKQPVRIPRRQTLCDECSVVWVFHRHVPIVDRVADFFADNSRGKTLLSSFFWFHERRRVEPIRVSRIAWFVRLYRNLSPSWDKALVERNLIGRLPPENFCTVKPWDDDDLPFERDDPDLAVACAAKWTVCDHIIVVRVDPAYRVGDRARDFARDRGVRLLEPEAAGFDRILLNRHQLDHELPTKGPWLPPDPVAATLVEPVPGFAMKPVVFS